MEKLALKIDSSTCGGFITRGLTTVTATSGDNPSHLGRQQPDGVLKIHKTAKWGNAGSTRIEAGRGG